MTSQNLHNNVHPSQPITRKLEASWDDVFDGTFPKTKSLPRRIFREALAEVAEQARIALPQSNGRVEKAVQIVLADDLVPFQDGRFVVGSQSDTKNYVVLGNECDCKDFDHAPDGACKHVIATWLWRKATALEQQRLDDDHHPSPTSPALPEAPASANVYVEIAGRKVQITLRDQDEQHLLTRMTAILEQFPVTDETPSEDWCSIHQVTMKRSKDGKGYYHKTGEKPDGKARWCRGK